MTQKISFDKFQKMLRTPDVFDSEIHNYLCVSPEKSSAFCPTFEPNIEKVELGPLESSVSLGNGFCRFWRRSEFNTRHALGDRRPVIVSEGDSWFQFPVLIKDVIDHLKKDYLVWSSGAAGDTAHGMIFEDSEYMEALKEHADKVKAFLFSAGGNDILGEDKSGNPVLSRLLRSQGSASCDPGQLVDRAVLNPVLDKLRSAYRTVIKRVRSEKHFNALPIIFHGYDFALPYPSGDNDLRNPSWAKKNEWLGKPMTDKGIHDPETRRGIVRVLINEFYGVLEDVAKDDKHVHIVDVRGTLTQVADWEDEIHPTSSGFAKVAERFREVIDGVLVPQGPLPEVVQLDSAVQSPHLTHMSFPPVESPSLSVEKYDSKMSVESSSMGFGNKDRFAEGFAWSRRVARTKQFEAVVEKDDSLPFSFLSIGAKCGRAVCKIVASGLDYRGEYSSGWSGSGFLVAPNVLLTNYHVLNSPEVAAKAWAIFNFHEIQPGVMDTQTEFSIDPDRLFIASPQDKLDYCFVWVNGAPQEEFGTIEFWRGSFLGSSGEKANIIHHPRGNPKRVSVHKNEIVGIGMEDFFMHYTADTEGGSSGSPVLTDDWRLFALHHASTKDYSDETANRIRKLGYQVGVLNEGIKTSAIAIDLDLRARAGPNQASAQKLLRYISGTDSRMGFFGSLGRNISSNSDDLERVVNTYRGTAKDLDIAFWNIKWFCRDYDKKLDEVARIIADINLDIWAFEESSPEATAKLVEKMREDFGQSFEYAASEPDASSGKQTTTVMWNKLTVKGERREWPSEVDELLRLNSKDPDAKQFEAIEGEIFNRYPGLFHFKALNRNAGLAPFDLYLVPLHLKAMGEGAKRRRMASAILAEAVRLTRLAGDKETDWIIGGDINAELSTNQFDRLSEAGFVPLSAKDEAQGAITYLARPKSLIDTIFISPNMRHRVGDEDFLIIARDEVDSGFIKQVSDHRPVMVRISLGEARLNEMEFDTRIVEREILGRGPNHKNDDLIRLLLRYFRNNPDVLHEIAYLLKDG